MTAKDWWSLPEKVRRRCIGEIQRGTYTIWATDVDWDEVRRFACAALSTKPRKRTARRK